MKKVLLLIMVLGICSVAMGQELPIPKLMPYDNGRTTLDGDLSDWDGEISWLALGWPANPEGQTAGGATDITSASYAVRWDAGGIFYAVTVTDTVPIYLPYVPGADPPQPSTWNNHDHLEVFIDSANTNWPGEYAYSGSNGSAFADAQQFIISPDPCGPVGSSQTVMGWPGVYPSAASVIDPTVALAVNGDTVTYEIYCAAQQTAGIPFALQMGYTVGVDIGAVSWDGANYAMLTANQVPNKWRFASAMQDWILIPEPITIVLLGFGGVALIRRSK